MMLHGKLVMEILYYRVSQKVHVHNFSKNQQTQLWKSLQFKKPKKKGPNPNWYILEVSPQ